MLPNKRLNLAARSSTSWPRFEEPFRRALARNVALAAVVGAVLALQRHDLKLLLPLAALALWFSLGGHYIELAFLNGLRARIPQGRLTQAVVRLVVWWRPALCEHGRHGARPADRGPTAEAMVVRRFPAHRSRAGGARPLSNSRSTELLQRAWIEDGMQVAHSLNSRRIMVTSNLVHDRPVACHSSPT